VCKAVPECSRSAENDTSIPVPREVPLSEIDIDSNEWNFDFFNNNGEDETLLGLIKLADSTI